MAIPNQILLARQRLFDYSFIALSLVILYIGALAILFYFAIFLILIVAFIPFMPFMTLAERYLLASIHRRIGPNVLSLLIPFYDGLKLILKALLIPLSFPLFDILFFF